jgi:hypothetical protein
MIGVPRTGAVVKRASPGLGWTLRKQFWNRLAVFKFKGNKPAYIPVPMDDGKPIIPVPLSSVSPGIPISNILVADHVPSDEVQPLKKLFYRFQLAMYRFYPAMQPGLPPIDDDPIAALQEAYDVAHRNAFPPPERPPEVDGSFGADIAALAVKGPFACYLERAPDGGFHWDLRELSNYEHYDGLYPLGVRVSFALDPATRRLHAERIESALGVHTPSSHEWGLVTRLALCAASTHLSLVRHFNWVHLTAGAALAIATRNELPADHPLRRVLWPHVFGTQYSNEIVTQGQMVEGGDFPDIFSFTHRGVGALFSDTHKAYQISVLDPALDARRRGIKDAGFATPSQENLERLFEVLHAHAERYVDAYYADDAAIARDEKIRGWLEALDRLIPNGIGEIAARPVNRTGIARLISAFIYMATVQHEVVGAGVWSYQLWTDRIPVRIYRNAQREPLDVYQRLVNANFNLNVHRAQLLQDFSYLALDQAGRDLFTRFLRELQTLNAAMPQPPHAPWWIRPEILKANINA